MALHWLALTVSPDCGYPKWFAFFMLPQNFFIFILFYDFYRKAYNKQPEVTESKSKLDSNNNISEGESSELKDTMQERKRKVLDFDKTIDN